jgi:hypothetical protein
MTRLKGKENTMAEATRMSRRQEARERMMAVLEKALEKYIPADENQPMKDGKFCEWEDMADEFDREVTGAFLEELAACSAAARLAEPGGCPHCGSFNSKWLKEDGQRERRSKHGEVVLPRQVARCRRCGRTFSPSGAALGLGCAGGVDTAGGRAGEPGGGEPAV